ncbi:MAG TPA: hypothetical protein VFV24_00175, partial [Candidatus Eisenbacteria bacterium]|nr:hypothetical protein [Candidatus Eisenbacteria bacterium]
IRIGTVARVGIEPNGLMKEILVRPAVDFRSVEEILVYTPSALRGSTPADLFLTPPAPADSVTAPLSPKGAPRDSAVVSPPTSAIATDRAPAERTTVARP